MNTFRNAILLSIFFTSNFVINAKLYKVNVLGSSFSPSALSIEAGDTVNWINNNNGSHNMNGSQTTFSANPESFGQLTISSSWNYSYVFKTAGTYNYQCDPHASIGMKGAITVKNPAVTNLVLNSINNLIIYPNPFNDYLTIQNTITCFQPLNIILYNSIGKELVKVDLNNTLYINLNTSNLPVGVYFLQIIDEGGKQLMLNKIIK